MKQVTEFYPPDWQYDKKGLDGYTYPDFRPFVPPDFAQFPTSKLSDKPFFRRLLLSLRDISHAASAATFIREDIDFDKSYGRADLRRFMCYETTLVVSYARPFSEFAHTDPDAVTVSKKRWNMSVSGSLRTMHSKGTTNGSRTEQPPPRCSFEERGVR